MSLKMFAGVSMSFRDFLTRFIDKGEVIAIFGGAELIRYLDGRLELRGGSNGDRIVAREWLSLFMNDRVAREV
jgi:hypothetical protein